MKSTKMLLNIIIIIGMSLMFVSCKNNSTLQTKILHAKTKQKNVDIECNLSIDAMDDPIAKALGLRPDEIRKSQNSFPLPNYDVTGPYFNFYMTYKRHPGYLLCRYAVNKVKYDRSMEKHWFKASLEQIRDLGHKKFPPHTKWIAVVISNIAEHKGLSTFEKSHKVGAIFNADNIFNHSKDLTELISHAKKNQHSIMYDPRKRTPGEQERWLIVEQHAANIEKQSVENKKSNSDKQPEKHKQGINGL
ncbi:MAG: hypothetical protein L3J71_16230 [Victivallaceae bacterium]|nr:hypothetical protein [Victivallaceae bacterium]